MSRSIEEICLEIMEFYRLGSESLRKHPAKGRYGSGTIEKEAIVAGLNPDTMRKARAFARSGTGYTLVERDSLIQSIRASEKRFAAKGSSFGRSHLIRLLSVPKTLGQRRKVQGELFANAWSVNELDTAIREQFRSRRKGGRRPRIEKEISGLLTQIDQMCESWIRLFDELERRMNAMEKPSLADLPEPLRTPMSAARKSLQNVRTIITPQDQ